LVKKSNLPQSLILLSGLAGIGFLFIQNRKVISQGVGNLLTRKPTPQDGEPTPESPLARAPLPAKDISLIGMDSLRRKTPRFVAPPPTERAKRQPTRTEELSADTGKVRTGTRRSRQLQENVRKPSFLSEAEKVSEKATERKFGITRRPSTKEGRKRPKGRVTRLKLFEEQEKARKIFDARSIVNF
jgi:hypothetical protein